MELFHIQFAQIEQYVRDLLYPQPLPDPQCGSPADLVQFPDVVRTGDLPQGNNAKGIPVNDGIVCARVEDQSFYPYLKL